MVKKLLCSLIILLLILIPSNVMAQELEPDNTPFLEFPVEVLTDGKLYSGILMSEETYKSWTQLKIDYNHLYEKNQILTEYSNSLKLALDKSLDVNDEIVLSIKSLKKEIQTESWWESNKFEIGVGVGVLTSVLIFVLAKNI